MLLLFSMLSFWAEAQSNETLIYSIIEQNIQDDSSSLYYPVLMEQYLDSAEFMTSEEQFHLYYGAIFQDNYSPILRHWLMDSIDNIFVVPENEVIDLEHLKLLCVQVLEDEPLNIAVLKKLRYAHEALGEQAESEMYHGRIKTLFSAILQSKHVEGDKTSYMVTNTVDIFHLVEHQIWINMGETMYQGDEESVLLSIKGDEKWISFNIAPALDYLSSM